MLINNIKSQQNTNLIDTGYLKLKLTNNLERPLPNVSVKISFSGDPTDTIEQLTTDSSGLTENLPLKAPPIELSLDKANNIMPYSEYTAYITAEGYEPLAVSGIEIFSSRNAILPVTLTPSVPALFPEDIVIPAHTLYGYYPPKIAEAKIKPIRESGEIVLSRVVVPETIIVHDGTPSDNTAKDYYVKFTDYIKNVASSEIYSTWPESTITANILAILSFTMNRIYTEWYRNKGYSFNITSSTAYDHKWIYGRNIFENISVLVDEIFDQYLSLPNVKQPILTQYCDGKRVTCPEWLSQWGSKYLGDIGYSPIEILRNYYGEDIYINSAESISGIPSSWPGYNLTIGARDDKVLMLQKQLNEIGKVYKSIQNLNPDGIYGAKTAEAVKEFQSIFGLPESGTTDFKTWYKISQIYVGVARLAER